MECTITCSTMVFALIAALALVVTPITATQPSQKTQQIIDRICRSLEDYQFCDKVFINGLPQPDTDYAGLTKIALGEAKGNATNTLAFIQSALPGVKDPAESSRYIICQTAYTDLVLSFDKAILAFDQMRYQEMMSADRDTPKIQATCTTKFGTDDPLNERNREMRILLEMAVIAGSNLVNNLS